MQQLVTIHDGKVTTTSLKVAEHYGKRHDNVVQKIDNIIKVEPRSLLNFQERKYKAGDGQFYRCYEMDRQGYSMLVFKFTGQKAIKFTYDYTLAFEKMEMILREKRTQTWIITREEGMLTRKKETLIIQKLGEYAKRQGSKNSEKLYMVYTRLANKMAKVENRDTATVMQLNNLSLMENIILITIRICMMKKMHYKDIYKACKARLTQLRDIAYLDKGVA